MAYHQFGTPPAGYDIFENQPPPPPEGDFLLKEALNPKKTTLHKALSAMPQDTSQEFERFKAFYTNGALDTHFSRMPQRIMDVSIFHLTAAMMGEPHLRRALIANSEDWLAQAQNAYTMFREQARVDPRLVNFMTKVRGIPV